MKGSLIDTEQLDTWWWGTKEGIESKQFYVIECDHAHHDIVRSILEVVGRAEEITVH